MATKSTNIKGFFKQKKKNTGGISKSKSSKKIHAAAFGSDVTLVSHVRLQDGDGDYDENEKVLRQFDMNMAFGPCLGMTRLGRWERAQRLGLNPPKEIEGLLQAAGEVESECLWDGRV